MTPYDQNGLTPEQSQSHLQQGWLPAAPQPATHPDVTEPAIHTANSCNEAQLQDGTPWNPDSARTDESDPTIEELLEILASYATIAAPPNPIDQFADAIAWQMIEQQLPGAIQASIQRILTNSSGVDFVRLWSLLQRMGTGIGPIKLSAILGGDSLQLGQPGPGGTP